MRNPQLHRLGQVAALGIAGLGLAACGMGGASTASSSAPTPGVTTATTAVTGAAATTAAAAPGTAHQVTSVVIGEHGTALGVVLTNAAGLTLYTFGLDTGGRSQCTGTCATAWPPVMVGTGAQPTSGTALPHPLGTIVRSGGLQATYDGHPLYRFAGDTTPGQTKGEGIKHLWFVATPADNLMTATPQPSSTMPPQPQPYGAPPVVHPRPVPAPPTMTPAPNPIPQGGGGDHDSDNSGGPNDGDGNI